MSNKDFKGIPEVVENMSPKCWLYPRSSNIFPFTLSKDRVLKPAELGWLGKPKLQTEAANERHFLKLL